MNGYLYRIWSDKSASFVAGAHSDEHHAIALAVEISQMYYHRLHAVRVERFVIGSTDLHGVEIYKTGEVAP